MNWYQKWVAFWEGLFRAVESEYQTPIVYSTMPPEAPKQPVETPTAPLPPKPPMDWNKPKDAYHLTRVIADELGLSLLQKNILCACIYQESNFKNSAKNQNKKNGTVWSTDYGICQVNDYFHCGKGKTFPSVQYVLDNPDKVVTWMAKELRRTGKLQPWASYTSKAYQQWLIPSSKMWSLKS